jgi:hypothetical protein
VSDQGKCPRCDAPAWSAKESGLRRYTCGSFDEQQEAGPFGHIIVLRQSEACSWHPNWINRKKQFETKETND